MPAVRRRQDLDRVSDFEREMNDRTADELYQQLRLGSIRTGKDPNDSEADEVWEGYEAPTFDKTRGAKVAAEEKARCTALHSSRMADLKNLRKRKEHQEKPAFDRIVAETQQWVAGHALFESSSSGGMSRRATTSQSQLEEDHELSQAGLADMLTVTPSYLRGKLRHYQLEGVNWLLGLFDNSINGILADEMGLGKTFQTIATVSYLKFSHGLPGPHLVVVPKSVLGNWFREFKKWCPALNVYRFHAGGDIRKSLIQMHMKPPIRYDVILTTYEMVLYEINVFSKIQWQYMIVDEAHKLKNEDGQIHAALAKMKTFHRLLITGTPLQNDLGELRALLHFLTPELFDDHEAFSSWFDISSGQQDTDAVSRMHVLLKPMMIRRLKSDVNTDIPPKKEIYVTCHMSKKQKDWYLSVMAKNAEALNRGSGAVGSLDNIIMHLRKVVNHPYLMPGAEDGPPFKTTESLVTDSGKMQVLDKLLKKLRSDEAANHKVLIFSQMTRMVDVLEDYCIFRGYKYCRLDGNTSSFDRDRQMAQFNNPNSEYFIFLLSTRAGGLGINLQAANNVILYDSDWNPQMDLQAQDRAHRLGQTRHVKVFRFVTDGTVDERIYKRALKKLYLDAMVVQQGRIASSNANKASKEEMLSMVKFGAEEIFKSRNDEVTDADIERLLDNGSDAMERLHQEMKGQQQASLANFQMGVEEANIYDFEGVSYKAGVESKMVHVSLNEAMSQHDLHAKCSKYGEILRVSIHPNMKEALVSFKTQAGASEALQNLDLTCSYAAKDAAVVVSSDMITECWDGGDAEELGRGKRKTRAPIDPVTEEQLERMQRQTKAPPLKLPKKPQFKPWQLFNAPRLEEIHNTEVSILANNWRRKYETPKAPSAAVKSGGQSPVAREDGGASPAPENDEDAPPVEFVEETLSPDEQAERERLMEEGFPEWSHDEYRLLLKILQCGRVDIADYARISRVMKGAKTEGEVRDYCNALFERGPKYIKNFSSVEAKIQKLQKRVEHEKANYSAAQWKIENCEGNPAENLKFPKSSKDAELDRFLFLLAYDNKLKTDSIPLEESVRNLPQNQFDVYYQTRNRNFYETRIRALVTQVRNERDRPLMESGQLPSKRKRKEGANDVSPMPGASPTTGDVSPLPDGTSPMTTAGLSPEAAFAAPPEADPVAEQ